MERPRHRGIQPVTGRVVPVVALTETAAETAGAVAGELAAALTRLPTQGDRADPVELLAIPGTGTPSATRAVPVRTGGLSAYSTAPAAAG